MNKNHEPLFIVYSDVVKGSLLDNTNILWRGNVFLHQLQNIFNIASPNDLSNTIIPVKSIGDALFVRIKTLSNGKKTINKLLQNVYEAYYKIQKEGYLLRVVVHLIDDYDDGSKLAEFLLNGEIMIGME